MKIKTKKLTEVFVYDFIPGIYPKFYSDNYEFLTIDKNKNIIKVNKDTVVLDLVEWGSEKEFSDTVIMCLVENEDELKNTIQVEFENVICDKSFDITKLQYANSSCASFCFLDFPEQYKNKAIVTPSAEMFGCIAVQIEPYYLQSSFFIVGPYTVETI